MTKPGTLIAAGSALVIVVVAVWQNMDGSRLTPSVYVKPPPPEPEYALELVSALNEYYSQKGEYPPYLLGGLAEIYQLKDPLIESHILQSYPEVQKHRGTGIKMAPIQNIVSSPDDPYVVYLRDKYRDKALTVAKRLEAQGKADEWSGFIEGADLVSKVERAMSNKRFLCGGGSSPNALQAGGEQSAIPFTYQYVDSIFGVIELAEENPNLMFSSLSNFPVDSEFGYQRGEYVGGDKHGCWLWFYSDRPVLTNNLGEPDKPDMWIVGLDLVDAEDGLIKPDGSPDGIVLLYKLKDGKVTEVVKKYD
jgi:hypothetical protein